MSGIIVQRFWFFIAPACQVTTQLLSGDDSRKVRNYVRFLKLKLCVLQIMRGGGGRWLTGI